MNGQHAEHISGYMYVAAFVPPFLSSHHAVIQFPHFISPPAQPFLCSYPQIFTNFDRFPILSWSWAIFTVFRVFPICRRFVYVCLLRRWFYNRHVFYNRNVFYHRQVLYNRLNIILWQTNF